MRFFYHVRLGWALCGLYMFQFCFGSYWPDRRKTSVYFYSFPWVRHDIAYRILFRSDKQVVRTRGTTCFFVEILSSHWRSFWGSLGIHCGRFLLMWSDCECFFQWNSDAGGDLKSILTLWDQFLKKKNVNYLEDRNLKK